MKPYIYGKRNLIHIINIRETLKGILRARAFIARLVAQGQEVLFVGTKRQAKEVIRAEASRVGAPYVAERWLGGTLTNFQTIRSRLSRLEELERLEATGELRQFSKKMVSTLTREKRKIARNLEGIRRMDRLPGALVVVDVRREHIAVKEAKKLGIPTICLIDTDSDPDYADIPIPCNDDAMRVIELIIHELADAVEEGRRARPVGPEAEPAKRVSRLREIGEPGAEPPVPEAEPAEQAPPRPAEVPAEAGAGGQGTEAGPAEPAGQQAAVPGPATEASPSPPPGESTGAGAEQAATANAGPADNSAEAQRGEAGPQQQAGEADGEDQQLPPGSGQQGQQP